METDEVRWFKLQIYRTYIEEFLHAGTCVEEREEHSIVTVSVRLATVNGFQYRAKLIFLQILDRLGPATFDGNREKTLRALHVFRISDGNKTCEGVDSC